MRALVRVAPDAPEAQRVVAQLLAAEARRAQKGEPELALEALAGLERAPPLVRLRFLAAALETLRTLRRRKVLERAEAALEAAAAELGAGPEELAELTARTGGLEPGGQASLVLDADCEARLALDPGGEVAVEVVRAGAAAAESDLEREERQAIETARRELASARDELARRLEGALVSGRGWPLPVWEGLFRAHPLGADLAGRLVWTRRRGDEVVAFDLRPAPADLFGEAVALEPGDAIGLLHPVALDPDELELWRERALERGRAAPFPQAFRRVAPPGDAPFARFAGRELYVEALGAFARSGWEGYPLRGKPPWTLRRPFPAGTVVLRLEDAPAPAPRRRPRPRGAAAPKKAPPPPKEAAPRARVSGVELRGAPGPAALAEAVKDLEELTDGLATVDGLFLRTWQQRKWKDPVAAWKEVVLRYRAGSPAAVDVRAALIRAAADREGLPVRLEDRFAIAGRVVVELGTGLCHEGAPKDHLPLWKVAEETAGAGPELDFPFRRAADSATVEVVERVIRLARRAG